MIAKCQTNKGCPTWAPELDASCANLSSSRYRGGMSFSDQAKHGKENVNSSKIHGYLNNGTYTKKYPPCKNGTATSPPPILRTLSFKSIIHCTQQLIERFHKLVIKKTYNRTWKSKKVPGAYEAYPDQIGTPCLEHPVPRRNKDKIYSQSINYHTKYKSKHFPFSFIG